MIQVSLLEKLLSLTDKLNRRNMHELKKKLKEAYLIAKASNY